MARTGRFGHLPADAPDLSASIVSLYTAYEEQRDRNILSAWQEGGTFEGKPVTDKRLLDWYRMRRDQVDPDDPMRDYWEDAYQQTRFAIAEQKANLHYQQEKWSESDMASFYREWAGKVPRASAAWRDLMTSAARFAKAARSGRASSNAEARAKAMNARLETINANMIQPAYDILNALNLQGQRGFEDGTGQGAFSLGGGTSGIYQFNTNLDSAVTLDEQLAAIQQDPGQRARMTQAIRQYIPGFDGNLTVGIVIDAIGRAKQGYRNQAKVLRAYGERDAARDRLAEGRKFDSELATLKVINEDLPDQYAQLTSEFDEDMATANGPIGRQMVREAHADALERMARRFEKNGALSQAGALRARAAALRGDESSAAVGSLDEGFSSPGRSDRSGKDIGQGSENGALVQAALADQQQLELLAKGGVVLTRTKPDGTVEEFVVPAGSEGMTLGVQGGSRVARRDLAYDGGTFHFASGDIVIPQGTITEAAVEQPVVISIPNPSDPASLVEGGLVGGNSLPTLGGRTRVMGTRTDWGNGEVMWGSPVGPGGRMMYSDVPPFQGQGIRAQGNKDGTWQVEYDPSAIIGMNADGGLGAILADVVDKKTGQPVLDAAGNVKQAFDPSKLVNGSPFITPRFADPLDPDQEQAAKDAAQFEFTVPGGAPLLRPEFDGKPLTTNAEWQQMVLDVSQGMDPNGPEFAQKYELGVRDRDIIAGALVEGQSSGAIKPFGTDPLPKTPQAVRPNNVPEDLWAQVVADRAKGLDDAALQAKYKAAFDERFKGNPRKQEANLRDAISQSRTPVSSSTPTTTQTPTVTSAADLKERGDAFDRAYYGALATNPRDISWLLPSMYKAAKSQQTRAKWADTVDPVAFVKKAIERDPSIAQNPEVYATLLEQVDVLTGAGRSGIAEGEFATERMIAGGVNPNIAFGATVAGQYTSRTRTSVSDVFNVGRTALPDEPRIPVPTTTPQGGATTPKPTLQGFLPDATFKAAEAERAAPKVPEVVAGGIYGQPITPAAAKAADPQVVKALGLRRAGAVRPSGVKPFREPKPKKPPKIKPPKIVVPEVPQVLTGAQTQGGSQVIKGGNIVL